METINIKCHDCDKQIKTMKSLVFVTSQGHALEFWHKHCIKRNKLLTKGTHAIVSYV